MFKNLELCHQTTKRRKRTYEDLETLSLELSYLCIAKYHLRVRTRIVLSNHADGTSTKGAVTELRDVLLIHIQIENTAMSNDRNQVRLIQANLEDENVTASRILQSTESVTTGCGKIDEISSAEDNSASVTFENRHLHLKGKIPEITALRKTVLVVH